MAAVVVRILHPEASAEAGPLERSLAAVRARLAERHRAAFEAAGAGDARVVAGPPDDTPPGARLRSIARAAGDAGLVILGSGALALARPADLAPFLDAAASGEPRAHANSFYSADAVAIGRAGLLADLPDAVGDNGLPRWLAEERGVTVTDARGVWRLGVDIDSPLDALLVGEPLAAALPDGLVARARDRLEGVSAVASDRRAELLLAGRTSAATLRWLERHAAARVRAVVEERGLRTRRPGQRPPASVLGALLERDGPGALAGHVARLADAALVDVRVLLAHRCGGDEAAWPPAEDRFAADLLLADRIADPWLRELTASAAGASIPIVLGGHTLVGPGARLAVRGRSDPRRRTGP